jgi:hypothetical protein
MENRTRFEIDWKQKAKDNLTVRTQILFGVIRNIYCKLNKSMSATDFRVTKAAKMLETHKLKVEQKKAETIAFLRRRTWAI